MADLQFDWFGFSNYIQIKTDFLFVRIQSSETGKQPSLVWVKVCKW